MTEAHNSKSNAGTLSDDFPILAGVSESDIVQEETRLDEPIAVIDSWKFGAQWAVWSDSNPLIVVDATTWNHLSDRSRDFLVSHEAHERDLSRQSDTSDMSPSDIVDNHHDEANRQAVKQVGKEPARSYSIETYELYVDDCGHAEACDRATHVLRGVEELVPEFSEDKDRDPRPASEVFAAELADD